MWYTLIRSCHLLILMTVLLPMWWHLLSNSKNTDSISIISTKRLLVTLVAEDVKFATILLATTKIKGTFCFNRSSNSCFIMSNAQAKEYYLLAHVEDRHSWCALESDCRGGSDTEHSFCLCLSDSIATEFAFSGVLTLSAGINSCLLFWFHLCDSRRDGIGNLIASSYWRQFKLSHYTYFHKCAKLTNSKNIRCVNRPPSWALLCLGSKEFLLSSVAVRICDNCPSECFGGLK